MPLKAISNKARKNLEKAIADILAEGHSCWGFIFAVDNSDPKDPTPEVKLELFNNHDKDPLPLFILKTENAITFIRGTVPEDFNLEAQEQAVADAVAGQMQKLPAKKNIIN
jgi:hypothetical protein